MKLCCFLLEWVCVKYHKHTQKCNVKMGNKLHPLLAVQIHAKFLHLWYFLLGEKPFECKLCHQRSRDYSAMIKHLRTHNGASPYQCTVCQDYCPSLAAMQKHMKGHKPEEVPADWRIEKTYLYVCYVWAGLRPRHSLLGGVRWKVLFTPLFLVLLLKDYTSCKDIAIYPSEILRFLQWRCAKCSHSGYN